MPFANNAYLTGSAAGSSARYSAAVASCAVSMRTASQTPPPICARQASGDPPTAGSPIGILQTSRYVSPKTNRPRNTWPRSRKPSRLTRREAAQAAFAAFHVPGRQAVNSVLLLSPKSLDVLLPLQRAIAVVCSPTVRPSRSVWPWTHVASTRTTSEWALRSLAGCRRQSSRACWCHRPQQADYPRDALDTGKRHDHTLKKLSNATRFRLP